MFGSKFRGLFSRAVSNQERVIMARVQYVELFITFVIVCMYIVFFFNFLTSQMFFLAKYPYFALVRFLFYVKSLFSHQFGILTDPNKGNVHKGLPILG